MKLEIDKKWGDYTEVERKEAVSLLHKWQYRNSYSFTDRLFDLFQKADSENLLKLRQGFNLYYLTLQKWYEAGDRGNDLFRQYDLRVD